MKTNIILSLAALLLMGCNGLSEKKKTFSEDDIEYYYHPDAVPGKYVIKEDPQLTGSLEFFKNKKYGMFITWGVWSDPEAGIKREWDRFYQNYSDEDYRKLGKYFNPKNFDAEEVCRLVKENGMSWIVLTVKHHDGFSIYPSEYGTFDVGREGISNRDVVKELSDACKRNGIKLGLYYSHFQDWDDSGGGSMERLLQTKEDKKKFDKYFNEKCIPQVKELLTKYGAYILWFDTPQKIPAKYAIKLRELVNEISPSTIINGRLGYNIGDYISPGDGEASLNPLFPLWETCYTSSNGWGYNSNTNQTVKDPDKLIDVLVTNACNGGALLLNMSIAPDGSIPLNVKDAFQSVGDWLKIYGEAIYDTESDPFLDAEHFVTKKNNKLYFFLKEWPDENLYRISRLNGTVKNVNWINSKGHKSLNFSRRNDGVYEVQLPKNPDDPYCNVFCLEMESEHFTIDNSQITTVDADENIILTPNKILDMTGSNYGVEEENSTVLKFDLTGNFRRLAYFSISEPGEYEVKINQASLDNKGYVIRIDNTILFGGAIKTKGLDDYVTTSMGSVKLAKAGIYTLLLDGQYYRVANTVRKGMSKEAIEDNGKSYMTALRSIILERK